MRAEIAGGFPPGEVGAKFNMISDLREGEYVYVRMQAVRLFDDTVTCCVLSPTTNVMHYVPVPKPLIVCREPEAMEADNGIVRGIS